MLDAIVIGNDHYNTLNVVRALGRENIRVNVVVQHHSSKSFVLKSKYIFKGYVVKDLTASWLIDNFAKVGTKIPILTTSDALASFLDANYNVLASHFVLSSVKNIEGQLTKFMDKNLQLIYAKAAGFDVPFSISINLKNLSAETLDFVRFPCIIKPEASIGGSKNDFRICHSIEELKNSLNELSTHVNSVLVQDFIPNDEVILIAGVRTIDGENFVYGEVNKTKHGKETNNLGLNCFGAWNFESELAERCKRYVDSIDYHGCYSVDAVRIRTASTDNVRRLNYFMEINLRTDGLLYFYTKAGINIPAIWVKSCYGLPIKINLKKTEVYGMNEFLYIKNRPYNIKDFLKADVFSTFSLRDIKPFIFRFMYHE